MSTHKDFPDYEFPEVGDKFTQTPCTTIGFGGCASYDNLEISYVHESVGHLFIGIHSDRRDGSKFMGYETEAEWVKRSKRFDRKQVK